MEKHKTMDLVARLRLLALDTWRSKWVTLVGVILVLLIGLTLARLVWLALEGPPVLAVDAVVSAPVDDADVRVYTPEAARHWRLFGDAAAPAAGAGAQVPETSLALQLLGLFSSGENKLAGAVIAERGKDGDLFRVGAVVPGGATLEKVEADRVLLRRRGQLETLRFDAAPADSVVTAGQDVASLKGLDMAAGFRGLRERMSRSPTMAGGGSGLGGRGNSTDTAIQGRALAEKMAADLQASPEEFMGEMGLSPAESGGYLVGDGPGAEAMRNLGLRPGDIILSVNGKSLGQVQDDARLVDEVKASGEARVEVRRGSQTFTVNYPL